MQCTRSDTGACQRMPQGGAAGLCEGMPGDAVALLRKRPQLKGELLCDGAPEMWNLLEEHFTEDWLGVEAHTPVPRPGRDRGHRYPQTSSRDARKAGFQKPVPSDIGGSARSRRPSLRQWRAHPIHEPRPQRGHRSLFMEAIVSKGQTGARSSRARQIIFSPCVVGL